MASLCVAAAGFGLRWIFVILFNLLYEGLGGLGLAVFTGMAPAPGASGGLLNAIVGSLIMTGLAVLFGAPVGVLAETYMAEYGRRTRITTVVRFVNDILLLAPDSLREAARALGPPRRMIIRAVAYKAAGEGIITGLLLAIAPFVGDPASLLFTTLNNQF